MAGFIFKFFEKVQYLEIITQRKNNIYWIKKNWMGNDYFEELLVHFPSKIEDMCFLKDIPKF